jgi:hypothetical protein
VSGSGPGKGLAYIKLRDQFCRGGNSAQLSFGFFTEFHKKLFFQFNNPV